MILINAGLGDVAQRTADVVSELDFCIVKNEAVVYVKQGGKSQLSRKAGLNPKNPKYIFSVDNAFIIRSWDSNMEKLCYRSAQDAIGVKLDKIFPMLYEKVSKVFIDGKKKQIKNFQNPCFRGSDLTADIQLNPIKDKKAKVKEVSIVFANISGGCPLDKTLSSSEKMIAIGKVASTLAHGIRNPLNAIKGAVVYLNGKYGRESTLNEFSKIINDEINRLDNFISNFLSTAKGEDKLLPTNLNDMIKGILVMIKPRTELQNIKISTNYSELPHIVLAPFQAEQAFFNIINNALEAMPDGGTLDIRTSLAFEDSARYAVTYITDTGKGIPKKTLFWLGELSTENNKDGRGFGIFLSREIIKSHGGKLFWESSKEKGTTFKVFLPIK